jgi:hypothetical protein
MLPGQLTNSSAIATSMRILLRTHPNTLEHLCKENSDFKPKWIIGYGTLAIAVVKCKTAEV